MTLSTHNVRKLESAHVKGHMSAKAAQSEEMFTVFIPYTRVPELFD